AAQVRLGILNRYRSRDVQQRKVDIGHGIDPVVSRTYAAIVLGALIDRFHKEFQLRACGFQLLLGAAGSWRSPTATPNGCLVFEAVKRWRDGYGARAGRRPRGPTH